MPRRSLHSHPCEMERHGCQHRVPCDGTLRRNHDGEPETVCDLYHGASGSIDAQRCASCSDDTCVLCERVVTFEGHSDDCSQNPENYDGPDPLWGVAYPFARNH